MRLASVRIDGGTQAAWIQGKRLFPMAALNEAWGTKFPLELDDLLQADRLGEFKAVAARSKPPKSDKAEKPGRLPWAPLVSRPRTLWGVGLNFRAHAHDLGAGGSRRFPGGFMRPTTSLAAAGQPLKLPRTWGRITGEAEIGVILSGPLSRASVRESREAVAGFAPLLDLTAEDLLKEDLRYLTRAKSFPTSVVVGPVLVSPDEWSPTPRTRIETRWNGKAARAGRVADMLLDPWQLLADLSTVFPWRAGDLLQTGTPGAWPLEPGGRLGALVQGLEPLECPVELAVT